MVGLRLSSQLYIFNKLPDHADASGFSADFKKELRPCVNSSLTFEKRRVNLYSVMTRFSVRIYIIFDSISTSYCSHSLLDFPSSELELLGEIMQFYFSGKEMYFLF